MGCGDGGAGGNELLTLYGHVYVPLPYPGAQRHDHDAQLYDHDALSCFRVALWVDQESFVQSQRLRPVYSGLIAFLYSCINNCFRLENK
jgi:hypothetical protein